MSRELAQTEFGAHDHVKKVVVGDILPLSVTHEKLIKAQKNDPSLVKCFKSVEN